VQRSGDRVGTRGDRPGVSAHAGRGAPAPAGVELRGCEATRAILPGITAATEDDWSAEYLDLILAVRVVPDLDAAMTHIETYGSTTPSRSSPKTTAPFSDS
jgi:hypothetical protein